MNTRKTKLKYRLIAGLLKYTGLIIIGFSFAELASESGIFLRSLEVQAYWKTAFAIGAIIVGLILMVPALYSSYRSIVIKSRKLKK